MYRILFLLLILPSFLAAEKQNLLLITIDTLRADHLGCYGNQTVRTPNLDRLTTQGLFFENAITTAPLTLPAHTSLLTGRYPYHHGVRDNAGAVDASELTLAEILKTNGYHTYAFVGGFPLDHRFGLNQGFDLYDDLFPRQKNSSLDFRSERGADAVVSSVLQTKVVPPFFVWVHLYDPHAPYLHGGYRGEIEFVDAQAGILLKKFESFRAVIAVAGDHGESLGEHGEWTHRIFVYDSTMKVPFWIHVPGMIHQRVKQQVGLIDFLPTILNILKIPSPKNMDGAQLTDSSVRTAYLESMFPQLQLGWSPLAAVRTGEWKLIEAPKPELYDLATDPQEKVNLYAKRPDVVKSLRAQLPKVKSVSAKKEISPEMAEQLASLGYVSGGKSTASNLDPKDRIAVWNQIEKAVDLEKTKPEETIAILESARKSDPENPMILGFLAQKYAEGNQITPAKAILNKVLAREPKNSLALYRMASVCLKNGEAAEARKWAESLRKVEASNADALILLAQANLGLNNKELAAENIREALKIDPYDFELRNDLGHLYLETKKTAPAKEQFERVLKVQPKNLQALNGLATCLYVEGDFAAGEATLQKAMRIDATDVQTRMNLALLFARQGKNSQAALLYREVAASPQTPPDWKAEATKRLRDLE